uniref:Uncharacterized protein n=1 Tax=Oryza rufipogon TaxID=4529 RepID=A0A0E0P3Q9_ORYRU
MEKTGNEAHKAQPNGLLWAYWEAHFKAFFFFSPRALPFVSTRKPRNQERKKSRTCDMDQEFHFDPFTGGDFDYPDGESFSGGAASGGFDYPGSCGRSSSAGEELHGHPYRDGYSFSGGAASDECHFLGRSGFPSSGGERLLVHRHPDRYRCGEPFSGGYARGHGDLLGWSSCHSSCSQLLQDPATIVIVINDGAHAHGGGLAQAGQASSMSVPLVKSKQGTSLVPQLKLGPSAAPNLLHWLMEHILWDALEFSISWTTLRRHQPKLPSEWSWWMAMGSPFIQIDGICSIAASFMCVEAQHRLAFEILHGIGRFPLKAKRLKGVKKKCINKKVWSPADGAFVEDVLKVVAKGRGVETIQGIFLPINEWISYKDVSHEAAVRLLLAHGPLLATLWVNDEYMICTTKNDLVYRGSSNREKDPNHTVVCFAYRFVGEELHLRVLDDHTEDGPVRWVLYECIDEIHLLTLKEPLTKELIDRYRKKGQTESFLSNSANKVKAMLIRRLMTKYSELESSQGSSSCGRQSWEK